MIKVILLGSGNVATHLFQAFSKASEVEVVQVFSRTLSKDFPESIQTSDFTQILEADVYIICVSDNAIANVSNQLQFENRLVVHTSGSTDFDVLDAKNKRGVFYPLQTFTKNKAVDFKEIPICLETENAEDYAILEKLAKSISNSVNKIDGKQRKALHVSAVFVCNFTNHLYQIGNEICKENNIPFHILQPLIEETAQKIKSLSPQEAQTGPAVRNDSKTIEKHIDFLTDENQKEIYKILTKSIQNVEKL
ncbi:Rossmann-like and DUF2520 domain-containing protein [Flavobacterium terrigena]|uniref:Predicted oxidoreductase, contains short-chain dehydrogenase (SDR) and DUF2520 domains n=1 Tax=Flavobacterium terrigena TaxID=402734 RepID=A0A1H6WJK2_9FLAO|nr:DUF2520 domain-containing protein [Flavobacterium terrigena]SEJ12525.1 Predicted oxidoreductase, contains short-chain dehydrogenase (SDR) and DUF2520 domains [Flavobacterium terrigena]